MDLYMLYVPKTMEGKDRNVHAKANLDTLCD